MVVNCKEFLQIGTLVMEVLRESMMLDVVGVKHVES
jgi:hypothetical protein